MEGAARIRRIEHDVYQRVLAANLAVNAVSVGAGLVAAITVRELPDGSSPVGPMAVMLGLSTLFFGIFTVVAYFVRGRILQPAVGWIREGRAASVSETLELIRQPGKQARVLFVAWAVGAPLIALYVGRYVPPALAIASGVLFLVAGTVAMVVATQNVEAYLRPVLAEALDGNTLSTEGLSVLPRLLSSWIFGSAAYLVSVIVALLAEKSSDIDMTYTAAAIAALGLVVGAVTTVRSARGVSNRVAILREAQHQVEGGDLGARVEVDDAGELGRLQAGFNRMVDGLAKREDLFGRHVGVDVARRALHDGAGLRGEERKVSVLFVDIVASTTLTQHVEPSRVIELLNLFFTEVIDCAAKHSGWVNKFEGDGALCIFGAPEDLPSHAECALRAAADLRVRLDKLSLVEPSLRAAIGVSTGLAVAGNVGNENRYEYTVIGDAVNEAARLSEVAKTKPGLLLASKRTIDAVHGAEFACWATDKRVRLRGREGMTTAFVLSHTHAD